MSIVIHVYQIEKSENEQKSNQIRDVSRALGIRIPSESASITTNSRTT